MAPSGTRPTGLIRGTVRPSSFREPVTRTTKMPIAWMLVAVGTVGFKATLVLVVCSHRRPFVVHVTVGTSKALDSASEEPAQLDWNARDAASPKSSR